MLILKTLFCSINSIKLSDKELFFHALDNLCPEEITCPVCGKTGHFKIYSHYNRYFIYIHYGNYACDTVSVPVLSCSCGHSQAALPDVLVAFGSCSVRFVLTVLHAYYTKPKKLTLSSLCSRWQISVSTLYAWIKQFEAHYREWCQACRKIQQLADRALSHVEGHPAFPESFHGLFHICFLQQCETHSAFVSPGVPRPLEIK